MSGPVAVCSAVTPPALTENSTSTVPVVPLSRATGGTTGRRPRERSGTPGSSVTSRTAETPFSGGSVGGGAVITSTGGGAVPALPAAATDAVPAAAVGAAAVGAVPAGAGLAGAPAGGARAARGAGGGG